MVNALTLNPLNDKLLVRLLKTEDKKGLLIIPSREREEISRGFVLKDSDGDYNNEIVVFPSYVGMEIPSDEKDEKYLLIKREDLLGYED